MRKMILLALVALVAGTVYAETSPAFSGSFEFYTTFGEKDEDTEFQIGNKYDLKISANGVIDEWTTVNAELTKDTIKVTERIRSVTKKAGSTSSKVEIGDTIVTDMDSYEIENTGDDFYGKEIKTVTVADTTTPTKTATITTVDGTDVYDDDEYVILKLNEFTMTNNITGALGFADSPVDVSLTWGKTSLGPASFQGVAKIGYLDHTGTDSYYGINVAVTVLDMVKVVTGIYPATYRDKGKEPVLGVDVQLLGLVEGLNVNIFYTSDVNKDTDGDTEATEEAEEIGLTAGYSGLESWNFGLATSYDLFLEKLDLGVSASYDYNDLIITSLAFVIEQFPSETKRALTAAEIAANALAAQAAAAAQQGLGGLPGQSLPTLTTLATGITKNNLKFYIELDVRYKAIRDVLDVVLSVKAPRELKAEYKDYLKDEVSADIGVEAFLGAVTYGLGYELNNRNKYSPNGDDSTGVYFKVKASF